MPGATRAPTWETDRKLHLILGQKPLFTCHGINKEKRFYFFQNRSIVLQRAVTRQDRFEVDTGGKRKENTVRRSLEILQNDWSESKSLSSDTLRFILKRRFIAVVENLILTTQVWTHNSTNCLHDRVGWRSLRSSHPTDLFCLRARG